MSYNLHIIRTGDFLQLNGKGGLDLEASKGVLSKLAQACVESRIDSALLDMRNARTNMQINDLFELACAFKEMGFRRQHRLAVLYRAAGSDRVEFFSMSPAERAEFFAMCAVDEGWNVRAFDSYEDAMEWFGIALPLE